MKKGFLLLTLLASAHALLAQAKETLWHGIEREIHYKPDGEDFVLVNGSRRFNRALYGGNTAFRVEAGDRPEFALYLPGMGGNLKFGLIRDGQSKWLIDATAVETRYRPGCTLYSISDPLLGSGKILLTVLSPHDHEAAILKLQPQGLPAGVQVLAVFGGATGQKFSRDGDIGADPESSFYLKPEYCKGNAYRINKNAFTLFFGAKALSEEERYEIQYKPPTELSALPAATRRLSGVFPPPAALRIADANEQSTPLQLLASSDSTTPVLTALMPLANETRFFYIKNGEAGATVYSDLSAVFGKAEAARKALAGRIRLSTPDSFLNTLGGALSVAADAVWDAPSFMHGAVAWRMRLPGWRGAYLADVLGWHDRARTNFNAYALSQVTEPATGPVVMDTALNLGRGLEKLGTSLFSSGYISRNPGGDKRPHHYDMNLVFVDQLLNHFQWTGDTNYVRQLWPLLVRHLDWEKRNFDRDGDGLYDAYAAIWASDALQYSGGGVAHSSAYNYRANKTAAQLAKLIGENGEAYRKEADKILAAINEKLWLKEKGWMAEYKDLLGEKLVHPDAGLWTIYHALDAAVPDAFQAYRMLRYVDTEIPHIPIRAKGLNDTTLFTVSTTNWQPYTWSLNNVSLGEVQHTALSYWQGGRSEEAYKLFKSSLVESMYLGASPGNFQQLSFYDAVRGELYRDFADDIGTTARSLVEGLFGIRPNRLHNQLTVAPGFPAQWNRASLTTPDIAYSFQRSGNSDRYDFRLTWKKPVALLLRVKAQRDDVESVVVNGRRASWRFDSSAVGEPVLLVEAPPATAFAVAIRWKGNALEKPLAVQNANGISLSVQKARLTRYFDPQAATLNAKLSAHGFTTDVKNGRGERTVFLAVRQGKALYWLPVGLRYKAVGMAVNKGLKKDKASLYETVNLAPFFNDDVKNIFKNKYLSPRPQTTTLQLPVQGIGNWAYPLITATVDDAGLRKKAGAKNEFIAPDGVPFATPQDSTAKNILFTSQWDNYPEALTVPLNGRARGACLLMAGSTNAMQSRLTNGLLVAQYADGTADTLELRNPENWWPIEQDYMNDGFAFTTDAPKPLRIALKTGEAIGDGFRYSSIKGFSNRAVDGGAATVLEMPLNGGKELRSLTLRTVANDVVIGLMAVTLVR